MNDALDQIEKDTEFGKKVASAIHQSTRYIPYTRDDRGFHEIVDIPSGNHANAAHVVETHHADMTHIISVGGNLGQSLGAVSGWTAKPEELLARLADRMGYRLVKKPTKKL
jgi:hypothetical protein